jgi:FG-GAP repeat
MRRLFILLAAGLLAAAPPAPDAADVLPPVRVEAGGKPLDIGRSGHAAPFFGDIDGDGLPDLLVGEFHGGRLRVYRNIGTKAGPRFGAYTYFEAGGAEGAVPVG